MSPDNAHEPRPGTLRLRALGLAAALLLARTGGAAAFPLLDVATEGQVPQGTDLAAPDVQDLRHQLQLVNGLAAPAGGGWTVVPRIDVQEMLTDNVFQVHSPRQADLVTYVAPGFSIAGDLPRMQLMFSYAPTLAMYTRSSSLNALTQQMNGLGTITLVPDLAYVDVRALSGVQNQYGGFGGLGGIGAPAGAAATAQTAVPSLSGNAQGLTRNNEVQTTSVGISPYLLRRFGDWGVGKIGYSVDVTRSNPLSGFASSPFPTGGNNGQSLVTNEQTAHFVTGDVLQYLQNSIDVDLMQSQTSTDAGFFNGATGATAPNTTHTTSTREIVTDQITYQVSRGIAVFAMGGHENISYSGIGFRPIDDMTWSLGTTLTPNPDSSLTLSYGHQDGFNSLAVNGHYAVTARTVLNVSYGSTLGTQLQNLQRQLNLATNGGNGTLVNGQTGGQLFGSTNALGLQEGVFRTDTLAVGSETVLDRDIISLNLMLTKQTTTGGAAATSTSAKTFNATWLHQMRPDMTVNAAIAYSLQDQGAAVFNPGNSTSIVASIAWQYQISDTLGASVRYSFLERQSAVAAYSINQNMLILGISKTF
ncbi:MAG: hypothetical protein P4L90_29430 [Rhodopila sp.]|nr:hypothetical protein [Rhodopila sp.]